MAGWLWDLALRAGAVMALTLAAAAGGAGGAGVRLRDARPARRRRPPSDAATLFQNVRIFDGVDAALSPPSNVLVRGNIIERISAEPIAVDAAATVIAGGGRVLMPGLIDAHWHAFMAATPQPVLMTADPSYLTLLAARAGRGDADARLHHGPRPRRSGLRAEARDRRGRRRRARASIRPAR